MKITLTELKASARRINYSISKRDGEYRLAPLGLSPAKTEDMAYYSTEADDVAVTIELLAERSKPTHFEAELQAVRSNRWFSRLKSSPFYFAQSNHNKALRLAIRMGYPFSDLRYFVGGLGHRSGARVFDGAKYVII